MARNVRLADMDLDVPVQDARRIEVVCNGLPLWPGEQLAVDATLVSPLDRDGQPRAPMPAGIVLAQATRRKQRQTCPELERARRCRLVAAPDACTSDEAPGTPVPAQPDPPAGRRAAATNSWLYLPLLLDGAGLPWPIAAASWRAVYTPCAASWTPLPVSPKRPLTFLLVSRRPRRQKPAQACRRVLRAGRGELPGAFLNS